MEQIRLSVRTLVEFTLHGEDLYPSGGSLRDMQEGMFGHKGRQKQLGDGWQAEVPLSLDIPLEDDELILRLGGRMDAFCDGEVPIIEEIKLSQGKEPPQVPYPAHRMQAVCYGHMLCLDRGVSRVTVRVAYVDKKGRIRAQFDEELSAEECREAFLSVLEPYVRRTKQVRAHRRARDASLRALQFPFETYRAGQRDMAVQVYTAIKLGRRLFASMPTGTGKSAASLFPAMKALGEGLTGQVYYLTARTTQRQGPLEALRLMRRQPLHIWTLTLNAKDKQCPCDPHSRVCHPDFCPRAKGHFLRDGAAIDEMLLTDDWSPEAIAAMADKHSICPFEFSLALAELADVTICDYNYALDPAVHIQRIFDRGAHVTLLIDEAHNLLSRVRDMLSGEVDGGRIRRLRTVVGKAASRTHPLYKAMTALLRALDDLPVPDDCEESALSDLPRSLDTACLELVDAFLDAQQEHFPWDEAGERLNDTLSPLMGFVHARRRETTEYAWLWQGQKTRKVTAFALDVADYLAEVTKPLSGVVCFSATMDPLSDMKTLLGGDEEDACFAMPSPFPRENLLVLQQDVNTRYRHRDAACEDVCEAIETMVRTRPGRYIAFFPSFRYMRRVAEDLSVPFQMQEQSMPDEARQAFLAPYVAGGKPVLSLCVLGGIFAEGIDLPGEALDGVVIVGVGLPQVNLFQETLRDYYDRTLGDGFRYAYMIPGMQKVAQAVGRVIRTETDRGAALLLDDRYRQSAYRSLCPPHWDIRTGSTSTILRRFWGIPDTKPAPERRKKRDILQPAHDYVVLDLETTGLDPCKDWIIDIGAVRVRGGEVVDTFTTLVKPPVEISGFITGLTGITNDMVQDAPDETEALPLLRDFLGSDPVLGHNVTFDIRFVRQASERLCLTPFLNEYIDTLRISQRLYPNIRHRLSDLIEYLGVGDVVAHRALSDVLQTKAVYDAMCNGSALASGQRDSVSLDTPTRD
ncbi:MAG: hypothetical protein J1E43_07985 [Christensenellaceae bacterium]|nr:hypothetical protein [Christensenellaceae bacterium]